MENDHIFNEMEMEINELEEDTVSCGDWVEVRDKFGVKVRGWLEYGYDENDSLFEFQNKEVDRILGGGYVQGVILRDMDRGLKEVKISIYDLVDIERMNDGFIHLRLEDYEALVDLSLVLKDENMFKEYSAMVRLLRRIMKGAGKR